MRLPYDIGLVVLKTENDPDMIQSLTPRLAMRRAVLRCVLPHFQRQPTSFRGFVSQDATTQGGSEPKITGILINNLQKCSPDSLRAAVQQIIDKVSPGLRNYEVQHQSATDPGQFLPGWPTNPHSFIKRGGEILVRSQSFNLGLY